MPTLKRRWVSGTASRDSLVSRESSTIGQTSTDAFSALKWFTANDLKNPTDYNGGRELADLAAFVTENSGIRSNIKSAAPSAVKQLNAGTFERETVHSGKDVLIAFKAPWCVWFRFIESLQTDVGVTGADTANP